MYIPNTWALAIALPYGRVGICEILQAADKALEQRLFFSMSAKHVYCVWHGKETKKYWNGEGIMKKMSFSLNTHLLE